MNGECGTYDRLDLRKIEERRGIDGGQAWPELRIRPGNRSRSGIGRTVLERKEKFRDSAYIGGDIVLLIVDDNSRGFNKKSVDIKIPANERRIVIKVLGRGRF